MNCLLSVTFHCTAPVISRWEEYLHTTLSEMIENLMDVENYILTEVVSDLIHEGKNYNLLLMFDDDEVRNLFVENELENIKERIGDVFNENLMIFTTHLNSIKSRL